MDRQDNQRTVENSEDPRRNGNDSEHVSELEPLEVPASCSICLNEPPVNAIQLNCGHMFCFLCIKSAAETTGTCALCRSEIGIEFNLQKHAILGLAQVPSSQNGFYWFYEGYRGWWLYDAETNQKIEQAYLAGERSLDRFIAGYSYTIDIGNMMQQRKDGDGRTRKIIRSKLDLDNILGMAGLKGDDFTEMLYMMRYAERN